MFQEGTLGDWRLKLLKEGEEERPWYTKLSNGEWVDLVVVRVKSCRSLRHSQGLDRRGWKDTRGSVRREGVMSDQYLLGAESGGQGRSKLGESRGGGDRLWSGEALLH